MVMPGALSTAQNAVAGTLFRGGLAPYILAGDHHFDRVRESEEFRALIERIR